MEKKKCLLRSEEKGRNILMHVGVIDVIALCE